MFEELKERLNLKENYVSMGLGLLVVILIGVAIFNSVIGRNGEIDKDATTNGSDATDSAAMIANLPEKYTLVEGEDLWSASVKLYGSGYNWVDLVEANKIVNPDKVEVGMELVVPKITPRPAPEGPAVQVYTVSKGETLFMVAEKMYGNGEKWMVIARANNLRNANRIEVGQQLIIPSL